MSLLNQYDAIAPADTAARARFIGKVLRTNTRELFAELRERRPIFTTPMATFITKYVDVVEVLRRPDIFTVKLYAAKMDPSMGPVMLARDNTNINYKDKSLMRILSPLTDQPAVRAIAGELADAAIEANAKDGKLEVIRHLGRGVPVRVVDKYFGFPGPDEDTMLRWSKATQSDFFKNLTNDAAIHAASVTAGQEMAAWLRDYLPKRQAEIFACGESPADVVGRLLATQFPGDIGFTLDRMLSNVSGLLAGSVETSSQAIAQALEQILLRPAVAKQAKAAAASTSLDVFDSIVWEALRFNPINPLVFRLTDTDTVIAAGTAREARIPKGTVVFACTASAMWDSEVIERADDFIPGRPSYSYMHFGYASHECLGKPVGGVMVPEVVRRLLLSGAALLPGEAGQIDFAGGPFPESFTVAVDGPRHRCR